MLYLAIRSLRKGTGKGRQGRLSLRWDEAAHPRGQAQNPGQFAPKGQQQAPAATAPKPDGNGQGREPVGELAAKLGRTQGAPKPRKPERLTLGAEDLEFSAADKQAAPYTWRVKEIARVIGNIFEPMALWALRDDQLEALRREVRRNDDEVGMMLVDVHRNVRKGFSRRQREDTRQTVFAMYREALGRQHPDDDTPVRKSLGKVTLEEAFAPPARPRGVRRLLVAVGGWLAKAFDPRAHPRHPAGSEQGGQFAPAAGGEEGGAEEPGPHEREQLYRDAVRARWPQIPDAVEKVEQLKKLWRFRNSRWGAHSAAAAAQILKITRREAAQLLRGRIAGDFGWSYSDTAGLDQTYLDVTQEPGWPTWEEGLRREEALSGEDLDEEAASALIALQAEAEQAPGGKVNRGVLIEAGFSRQDAVRLLEMLEARGAIVPAGENGQLWTVADGEWLAKAAGQLSLFDESKVERHPQGSSKGGQFAPKGRTKQQSSSPAKDSAETEVRQVGGSYQDRVGANMEHLETDLNDWGAVAIKRMVEVDDGGKSRMMPEFEFPKDYEPAPSLFRMSGQNANCELCGHPIKNVYWIQHDGKRWTMGVGSECITLFEEKSGQQLGKEALHQQRVDLLLEGRETARRMYEQFNVDGRLKPEHGKPWQVWRRLDRMTQPAGPGGAPVLEDVDEDVAERHGFTKKGQVTRYVNQHEEELRALLAAADELSAGGDPELPRKPSNDPHRAAYARARRVLEKVKSGEWEVEPIWKQQVNRLDYMLRLKDGSMPEDLDLSDEQVDLWRAGRGQNVGKEAEKLATKVMAWAGREGDALEKAVPRRRLLVAFGLRKSLVIFRARRREVV